MNLTDFCQYTEIRAVLGVLSDDIDDETLALPLYGRLLSFALAEVDTSIEAFYLTLKDKDGPTAQEVKFVDLVQVFSGYAVAKELLPALPQFAAQRFVHGKDDMERKPFDPAATEKAILTAISRLSDKLLAAYAVLNPSSAVQPATRRTLFSSSRGTDPVTNA